MIPSWSLFVLLLTMCSLLVQFAEAKAIGRTQKPAIILVPAAFSKATVYDQVKSKLCDAGFDVTALDLPSVGPGAEHVDRTPDVKVVQNALGQQIRQGRKVVLVGNSYGCTVICDALKDFEYESAISKTADGKILGVIFVSFFDVSGYIPVQFWLRRRTNFTNVAKDRCADFQVVLGFYPVHQ